MPDYLEQPHGSVLYAQGKTIVLCTATVEEERAALARGEGAGLDDGRVRAAARVDRRAHAARRLARPAGRAHRRDPAAHRARAPRRLDFEALGERTLWLDCDVLQADGGTRCASITGAWIAARRALDRIRPLEGADGSIAAVSVGIVEGEPVLDLDYAEDSTPRPT